MVPSKAPNPAFSHPANETPNARPGPFSIPKLPRPRDGHGYVHSDLAAAYCPACGAELAQRCLFTQKQDGSPKSIEFSSGNLVFTGLCLRVLQSGKKLVDQVIRSLGTRINA